jgi:hypothetical protein
MNAGSSPSSTAVRAARPQKRDRQHGCLADGDRDDGRDDDDDDDDDCDDADNDGRDDDIVIVVVVVMSAMVVMAVVQSWPRSSASGCELSGTVESTADTRSTR